MKHGQSNVTIWAVISLCSFLMSKRHQSQWLSNTKCPSYTSLQMISCYHPIKRSFSTAQPLGLVLKRPPFIGHSPPIPPNPCSQPSKVTPKTPSHHQNSHENPQIRLQGPPQPKFRGKPPNPCSQPSKLAIDPPRGGVPPPWGGVPPYVPGTPSCRNRKFYTAKRTRISGFPGYPRGFSRFLAKKWKIDRFSMKSQWLSNTNSVLEVLGVRNTGLGGGTPPLGGGTPPLGGSGVSFRDIFTILRLFPISRVF